MLVESRSRSCALGDDDDVDWVVVGIIGMGRPIVDRRQMFGDDPRNDPYSIDYEPSRRR
jgi:hypothetical protein